MSGLTIRLGCTALCTLCTSRLLPLWDWRALLGLAAATLLGSVLLQHYTLRKLLQNVPPRSRQEDFLLHLCLTTGAALSLLSLSLLYFDTSRWSRAQSHDPTFGQGLIVALLIISSGLFIAAACEKDSRPG